jgi:ureidoacrylate peracid hydrolase
MSERLPLPTDLPPDSPSLPRAVVERALYRRGRLAVYDTLDPRRTALLVMDMQRAWLAPGAPFETPVARTIVPAINRLAAGLRAHGGQVVWFQHSAVPKDSPDYWAGYYEVHVAEAYRADTLAALRPGSVHHALDDSLDLQPTDWCLRKYRFSPFLRNPDNPLRRLEAAGIDTVIVVGTATNVSVESTVRDAMMLDFKTFMPHDAVVAAFPDAHAAALRSIVQLFADVRPVDELLALMASAC